MSKAQFKLDGEKAIIEQLTRTAKVSREQFVRTMQYLGEQGAAHAKDRAQEQSWYDDTGNLRNSIGYTVYDGHAEAVPATFAERTGGSTDGSEGREKGQAYIRKVATEASRTDNITLVLAAGMSYASNVEAIEGKDVLASAELLVKQKLPVYIQKTKERILKLLEK